ncbi:DUF4332 domain-containing protein [Streptomyces hiroshimensis]|uniref:DUF4332 domain-containing protein n=1 Tax=Streptomyces hiroshimensis TaxID=66424 RepID=A0ABQ2Y8Z4_9ACTN|nr:DUF4332 domain-containing protein [Streptomyces hiroshimensis]GGX76247.1 hypothetical protein GCM10010324_22370 [Streptomyces hiroshimensis]
MRIAPWRWAVQVAVHVGRALLVLAAPERVAAAPPPPDVACRTAAAHLDAGQLKEAEKLYTMAAAAGTDACAIQGLKQLSARRVEADGAVIRGHEFLRTGEPAQARESFEHALKLNVGSVPAAQGLGEARALQQRGTSGAWAKWQSFYSDWVNPIVTRLLLPAVLTLVVLLAISRLCSGLLVRADAVSWPKRQQRLALSIGTTLLAGGAFFFPVYPMFRLFHAEEPLVTAAAAAMGLILLGIVAILVLASRHHAQQYEIRHVGRQWKWLLCSLCGTGALTALVWWGQTTLHRQIVVLYGGLVVFGLLITSAAVGQNRRLQVHAQAGGSASDEAATDYVLARLQSLGMESPRDLLAIPALTPLSRLSSEDLSALPSGPLAGALARVFSIFRPDLTWRARVTIMDDNRVTVALTRNGRHAESVIFSRLDLALPSLEHGSSELETTLVRDRAHAQLLTGAAAFILIHLSQVHPELRGGLCGAENWKSVTQQVIACSKSLIDDPAGRVALLARAVDEDPSNVLARFEYVWALLKGLPDQPGRHRKIAETVELQYQRLPAIGTEKGWEPLHMRALYKMTAYWLNHYVESDRRDTTALSMAQQRADQLIDLCKNRDTYGKKLEWVAKRMLPIAENLRHNIDVTKPEPVPDNWLHPHTEAPPSPRLAYNQACLECLLMERNHTEAVGSALDDLRFALATEDDRDEAWADPFFRALRPNKDFQRLIRRPPIKFLDLPAFSKHRSLLDKAGISVPDDLVGRTATEAQRNALASYLSTSSVIIDRFRALALLAQVHPDLNSPTMLFLLEQSGVSSPAALVEHARSDPRGLLRTLRREAATYAVHRLAGLGRPHGWLVSAGLTPLRARAAAWGRRGADNDRPIG